MNTFICGVVVTNRFASFNSELDTLLNNLACRGFDIFCGKFKMVSSC